MKAMLLGTQLYFLSLRVFILGLWWFIGFKSVFVEMLSCSGMGSLRKPEAGRTEHGHTGDVITNNEYMRYYMYEI